MARSSVAAGGGGRRGGERRALHDPIALTIVEAGECRAAPPIVDRGSRDEPTQSPRSMCPVQWVEQIRLHDARSGRDGLHPSATRQASPPSRCDALRSPGADAIAASLPAALSSSTRGKRGEEKKGTGRSLPRDSSPRKRFVKTRVAGRPEPSLTLENWP